MKNVKCPHCGEYTNVDVNQDISTCEHCKDQFVTEKALNKVVTANVRTPRSKRPKFNVLLFIILLCLWFVPGFVYLILVLVAQKKWDDKYTY